MTPPTTRPPTAAPERIAVDAAASTAQQLPLTHGNVGARHQDFGPTARGALKFLRCLPLGGGPVADRKKSSFLLLAFFVGSGRQPALDDF